MNFSRVVHIVEYVVPNTKKGEESKQGIITPLKHDEVEKDSEVAL